MKWVKINNYSGRKNWV